MRILTNNFLCHQVLSDSQWAVYGMCTFFLCEICVPTESERNLVAGGMGKYIHPSLALYYMVEKMMMMVVFVKKFD